MRIIDTLGVRAPLFISLRADRRHGSEHGVPCVTIRVDHPIWYGLKSCTIVGIAEWALRPVPEADHGNPSAIAHLGKEFSSAPEALGAVKNFLAFEHELSTSDLLDMFEAYVIGDSSANDEEYSYIAYGKPITRRHAPDQAGCELLCVDRHLQRDDADRDEGRWVHVGDLRPYAPHYLTPAYATAQARARIEKAPRPRLPRHAPPPGARCCTPSPCATQEGHIPPPFRSTQAGGRVAAVAWQVRVPVRERASALTRLVRSPRLDVRTQGKARDVAARALTPPPGAHGQGPTVSPVAAPRARPRRFEAHVGTVVFLKEPLGGFPPRAFLIREKVRGPPQRMGGSPRRLRLSSVPPLHILRQGGHLEGQAGPNSGGEWRRA